VKEVNRMAKDPVCGALLDDKKLGGKSKAQYNGGTYYFCCTQCWAQFTQDPAKYVQK